MIKEIGTGYNISIKKQIHIYAIYIHIYAMYMFLELVCVCKKIENIALLPSV